MQRFALLYMLWFRADQKQQLQVYHLTNKGADTAYNSGMNEFTVSLWQLLTGMLFLLFDLSVNVVRSVNGEKVGKVFPDHTTLAVVAQKNNFFLLYVRWQNWSFEMGLHQWSVIVRSFFKKSDYSLDEWMYLLLLSEPLLCRIHAIASKR